MPPYDVDGVELRRQENVEAHHCRWVEWEEYFRSDGPSACALASLVRALHVRFANNNVSRARCTNNLAT